MKTTITPLPLPLPLPITHHSLAPHAHDRKKDFPKPCQKPGETHQLHNFRINFINLLHFDAYDFLQQACYTFHHIDRRGSSALSLSVVISSRRRGGWSACAPKPLESAWRATRCLRCSIHTGSGTDRQYSCWSYCWPASVLHP